MTENKIPDQRVSNRLAFYRRRMGFSQQRVVTVLGHKSHGALSNYEHGHCLPTLENALRLEIILRTPVAFLYPDLYDRLKAEIRGQEEQLAGRGQQELPLPLTS